MPYQQLGDFSNIIQAVETVKENLPHTKQNLDDTTIKSLKFMKKVQNPVQLEPGRTIKILRQYQDQLAKLRASSIVEPNRGISQFLQTGQRFFKSSKSRGDPFDKQKELQLIRLRNGSLDSPSLRELVTSSFEGKSVLKS